MLTSKDIIKFLENPNNQNLMVCVETAPDTYKFVSTANVETINNVACIVLEVE